MKIASDISQIIGGTPLVRLSRLSAALGAETALIGKVEGMNPAGSIKDRTALSMLDDAQRRGLLKEGGTVIEPTSGNTGIGLAALCAVRGYKLVLTMPESMSEERRKLLKALGAELVLTPAAEGMSGAAREAERLHKTPPTPRRTSPRRMRSGATRTGACKPWCARWARAARSPGFPVICANIIKTSP